VVEGTFDAPYSVVALAAYEALSQFDSESDSVSLVTVNYVNIVAEVTYTFLSTFEDELKKRQNTKLHISSADQPIQHLAAKFDESGSNEEQIASAVAESNSNTKEEPVHVRMIDYYCA